MKSLQYIFLNKPKDKHELLHYAKKKGIKNILFHTYLSKEDSDDPKFYNLVGRYSLWADNKGIMIFNSYKGILLPWLNSYKPEEAKEKEEERRRSIKAMLKTIIITGVMLKDLGFTPVLDGWSLDQAVEVFNDFDKLADEHLSDNMSVLFLSYRYLTV